MTEHSGETCVTCGEPIVDGDVQYRPASTVKHVNPDGTEKPGNPLDTGFAPFCSKCAEAHDKSN